MDDSQMRERVEGMRARKVTGEWTDGGAAPAQGDLAGEVRPCPFERFMSGKVRAFLPWWGFPGIHW